MWGGTPAICVCTAETCSALLDRRSVGQGLWGGRVMGWEGYGVGGLWGRRAMG